MKLKQYLHTRLRVSHMETSLKFWTEVMGLEIEEQSTSPRGSQITFLKMPGTKGEMELCYFPDSGPVEVPEDLAHIAFEVDSLDDWIEHLNKAGAPITEGPIKSRSGSFLFTEDPDKYEIELIQPS